MADHSTIHVKARVHNSTTQAIPTSTWTSVTFDSERFDVGGLHSTASNTSRFTIVTTGHYLIGAHVEFAASSSGTGRFARILLNGTTRIADTGTGYTPVAGNVVRLHLSTIYALTATDYVEVQMFQDTGGNLNSAVTANSTPEFWIVRVA